MLLYAPKVESWIGAMYEWWKTEPSEFCRERLERLEMERRRLEKERERKYLEQQERAAREEQERKQAIREDLERRKREKERTRLMKMRDEGDRQSGHSGRSGQSWRADESKRQSQGKGVGRFVSVCWLWLTYLSEVLLNFRPTIVYADTCMQIHLPSVKMLHWEDNNLTVMLNREAETDSRSCLN